MLADRAVYFIEWWCCYSRGTCSVSWRRNCRENGTTLLFSLRCMLTWQPRHFVTMYSSWIAQNGTQNISWMVFYYRMMSHTYCLFFFVLTVNQKWMKRYVSNGGYEMWNKKIILYYHVSASRGTSCIGFHHFNVLREVVGRNTSEEDGVNGWRELISFLKRKNGNSGLIAFLIPTIFWLHLF